MALGILKSANRVIGIKQVTKVVNKNLAGQVFVAANADERVLLPLRNLCQEKEVAIVEVPTMAELGKACDIEVGAAAAAILK